MTRVLIEIHEGQIVRNLLENGLLTMLTAQGAEVLLVTPATRVPEFTTRYSGPGVQFRDLLLLSDSSLSRAENYEFALGKWLCQNGHIGLRRAVWQHWGQPMAVRRSGREKALITDWKPDVVVSTHLSQVYGRRLVAASRDMGIPTVGNVASWDNVWKGLRVRPETVTCWSANNRDEVCRLGAYLPEHVEIIGAPAFDSYFAPDAQWTREDLCARLGLDPARPFLVFATLGQFSQQIDETFPLKALLCAIEAGQIRGKPQVVLRMHPWSRDMYFKPYMSRSDVVVSRYETYVPGLGWSPTREEAILAGNLLRHAAVVVSPGSTMCIEPAIFDTPTVVPAFNDYMPEVFEKYFRQTWLNQHFGRLYKNDWVPIPRSNGDMIAAINRGLEDRTWYREGRRHIRDEFLGPLDGKATERLAQIIVRAAESDQRIKG